MVNVSNLRLLYGGMIGEIGSQHRKIHHSCPPITEGEEAVTSSTDPLLRQQNRGANIVTILMSHVRITAGFDAWATHAMLCPVMSSTWNTEVG